MYTYLLINLASVAIPIAISFEKRDVYFFSKWKYLFPAILLTGIVFIVWDVIFTSQGVWGFNELYLSGIYLFHLPIGEWLFFVTIPFACVFSYEALNYHIKRDILGQYASRISAILIILLLVIGIWHHDRIYTSLTFIATALFLLIHQLVLKSKYMGRFYLAYVVVMIPFLLVNGILTGSFIPEEVVWYNDLENLGVRIFTIPVEDTIYGMLLILMNITIYEGLKNRKRGGLTSGD
jgi:lycopene cyclase domain-containing protein